ncbi:MAG TPA: hypothetical protein VGZ47_08810 [Gemmataceae bacterium]|nr:hypothetical protein [Gemmataceae bacterium]
MQAIADALVYAVVYINCRPFDENASRLDDDVRALDSIGAFLQLAGVKEEDALAAAAERALAAEQSAPSPRPEFVEDYGRWMENMFGDGWNGNRRVRLNER